MYQPYDKQTASTEDRIAWALCQIIDDDAPMRWTRYRFAAGCIAKNKELMADLASLAAPTDAPPPSPLLAASAAVLAAWDKLHGSVQYTPGAGDLMEDIEFREMQELRAAIARATGAAS